MFAKSREPASVFAAAGPGWGEPAFMGGDGGRTPARACRSWRPTGADSPREDFENSSIYPSRRLDTVARVLSELQHRLDRSGKSVALVAVGHVRRVLLDAVGRIAHRKRNAAPGKHRKIKITARQSSTQIKSIPMATVSAISVKQKMMTTATAYLMILITAQ
jgi:hypothetical protein